MHGQALLQERHERQHLRRVPAERAVFQRAVVLGEAEEFQGVESRSSSRRRGCRSRSSAARWCPRCRRCRRVSSASLRSGRPAGVAFRAMRRNNSSCGSFAPSGDQAPNRTSARRVAESSPRRRCPCDTRISSGISAAVSGTICFSLISRLNGHITAPMRQARPSRSGAFRGIRRPAARTRLPLLQALALERGRNVDGGALKRAEADRRAADRDRRWRSCPDRAWRTSQQLRDRLDRESSS